MRAQGLSLWLVPEGAARERLAGLIDRFALRLGTPRFEPHVTLLGGLPGPPDVLLAQARELAGETEPFRARATRVGSTDEYFRRLFLEIAPSPELLAASERARRRFGRSADPPFFPHLSLVYGTLPADLEAELARDAASVPAELEVRAIDAWKTDGEVADWRPLARFPLAPGG